MRGGGLADPLLETCRTEAPLRVPPPPIYSVDIHWLQRSTEVPHRDRVFLLYGSTCNFSTVADAWVWQVPELAASWDDLLIFYALEHETPHPPFSAWWPKIRTCCPFADTNQQDSLKVTWHPPVYPIQDTEQFIALQYFTEYLFGLLSIAQNPSPHAAGDHVRRSSLREMTDVSHLQLPAHLQDICTLPSLCPVLREAS